MHILPLLSPLPKMGSIVTSQHLGSGTITDVASQLKCESTASTSSLCLAHSVRSYSPFGTRLLKQTCYISVVRGLSNCKCHKVQKVCISHLVSGAETSSVTQLFTLMPSNCFCNFPEIPLQKSGSVVQENLLHLYFQNHTFYLYIYIYM